MYRTTIMIIALLTSSVVVNGDSEIKLPQANEAIAKHDKQVAAAEAAYKQALIKAKTDCVRDLKVALNLTTRKGDLDDANRINAEIGRLQAAIDNLMSKLRKTTYQIPATTMWNKTVRLTKGQAIRVQATGEWSPNGGKNMKGVDSWPPRGRIGEGKEFPIGADRTFIAETDGVLEIGIDDGNNPNVYNDNLGSITVTITFLPLSQDAPVQVEKN